MSKEKIIKVLLLDMREVELKGGQKTLENVEYELGGQKPYVQEYETIKGEIITDLDIASIIK